MYIANLLIQLGFWISWLLVPIIYEFIPAVVGFFSLLMAKRHLKNIKPLKHYPYITLIIPVYNSADTLFNCIKSIKDSSYPEHLIKIIVVDNKSTDDSYQVYLRARKI